MALCRVQWTLLMLVILKIVVFTSGETCEKISTCSCKLSDGGTVDLKAVDGTSTKPSFTGIESDSPDYTFDWNPCTSFTDPNAIGCSDVMVCQISGITGTPVGSKNTSFSVNSDGNVVITYGAIQDSSGYSRKSEMTLKCDAKQPGKGSVSEFKETKEPAISTYSATFTSSHACPTGGSGGLSSGGLSVEA